MPRFAPAALAFLLAILGLESLASGALPTWSADNGNGTFTNPLLQDEFSDPDLIRVGEEYFLTGTTMHAMPGLPMLRSRDLVNWHFVTYIVDRLDFTPQCRLEGGSIYGQGIWAPCLRFNKGTFYVFSNVNGRKTQVFSATEPAGPWKHWEMRDNLHDLSVLFDDDGRIYVIWNYNEVKLAELEPDLSGVKPGTTRVIIPAGSGMGEGAHFYKIKGRYYITSANYDPTGRMQCARADRPEGPYETVVISANETLGVQKGWWADKASLDTPPTLLPPTPNQQGAVTLHQGGLVELPNGDWWGFSMGDANSLGRLTHLSPVTWQDGWPYFGLPGNLTRSPRTWLKPNTGWVEAPHATYQRSDDFSSGTLLPIWQWNHAPDDARWSLAEKSGALRLHTLPAADFLRARNSLTQRAVGPESTATVDLDASALAEGDIAGLALLGIPYYWAGVTVEQGHQVLRWQGQLPGQEARQRLVSPKLRLRVHCDFVKETADFSYAEADGVFHPLGTLSQLAYQLKTFQGIRYALFAFNQRQTAGGHADFSRFQLDEPEAARKLHAIPVGRTVLFTSLADGRHLAVRNGLVEGRAFSSAPVPGASRFRVEDRGRGRVALVSTECKGTVWIAGLGVSGDVRVSPGSHGEAELFQWQDMQGGACMLLSVKTQRCLQLRPQGAEPASADSPGAQPDRLEGSCFTWQESAD